MAGVKKDKNAPKRPCSGYILFCNDQREEFRKKNPSLPFSEISKNLAQMWRDVSDKVRAKYNEKSQKDKERYQQEMKEYIPPVKEEKKTDKKEKADKPKRNPSGYIIFCNSVRDKVRKQNSNLDPKDVIKKLGEMWRELDAKEKEKYNEKSKNYVRDVKETKKEEKKESKKDTKKEDKKKKKQESDSESEEEVEYYEEYYTDDE